MPHEVTMTENLRLQFDIACALAILSPGEEYPIEFPKILRLDDVAKKILTDYVDADSFGRSKCRIKNHIPQTTNYHVPVGSDKLTLFPGGEIRAGGSGVTIQLHDARLNRHFALKVPRVSVLAYMAPAFSTLDEKNLQSRITNEHRAFENERLISRRLSHENVARHFYGSKKHISQLIPGAVLLFPFSISEWIEGALPLHEYLIEKKPSLKQIISLVSQTFSALSHLHLQQVLHWDLKSDNILVSKYETAKIIDFGNSKLLDGLSEEDLVATTTKGKYPDISVFEAKLTEHDESRRFRIEFSHLSWNHPFIDLWMLAQEWNRCLVFSERFVQGSADLNKSQRDELLEAVNGKSTARLEEARDCMRIVFDRILYPLSQRDVTAITNEDSSFNHRALYFDSARAVMEEISRIQPPFGAGQEIPELLVSLDEIVRLPVTGNSVFTRRVAAIVDSKIIEPTSLHYQLAQVRQVFPGATHTRFEHLLGTLTTAAYFVRSLYLNDMNAFWRVSVDAVDIRAVLLAAILHDSGHLAFGHLLRRWTT
jgi:hypothetical protein